MNYPGCKNDLKNSVESSGITLVAFDPRVPQWFDPNGSTASLTTNNQMILVGFSGLSELKNLEIIASISFLWTTICFVKRPVRHRGVAENRSRKVGTVHISSKQIGILQICSV